MSNDRPLDASAFVSGLWLAPRSQWPDDRPYEINSPGSSILIISSYEPRWVCLIAATVELAKAQAGSSEPKQLLEGARLIVNAARADELPLVKLDVMRRHAPPVPYRWPPWEDEDSPGFTLRDLFECAGNLGSPRPSAGSLWVFIDGRWLDGQVYECRRRRNERRLDRQIGAVDGLANGVRQAQSAKTPRLPRGGKGYKEKDAPLIEEMRRLIETGAATSVWAAAVALAPNATGGGTNDSKAKRLLGRFLAETA
jgi:hypothetical protein